MAPVATRAAYEPALVALAGAGVAISLRKASALEDGRDASPELDILLQPGDVRAADQALRRAGFNWFAAPQAPDHRFYLAFNDDRWLKIDAKIAGRAGRAIFARLRPAGLRRLGPVIAILGPDGAGKGAIIPRLVEQIPVGVTVAYLGWRPRRKKMKTSIAPSSPNGAERSADNRSPHPLRECAFVLLHALRFLPRLLRVYLSAWKGYIVICDRHPLELLAIRPRRTTAAGALERMIWRWFLPWPDAIVLLDAPADVLLQRKDEHPVELLEAWRRAYSEVFSLAKVISTTVPLETSVRLTSAAVWNELKRRRRW